MSSEPPSSSGSLSCLSSCLPSCRRADVNQKSLRPPTMDGRASVYHSSREDHQLTESELEALRLLEDAAASKNTTDSLRDSQYFFDALEEEDGDSHATMTYPPAAVVDPHPRASVVMDKPTTLLGEEKKPKRQVSRRRSSVMRLLKAPRVSVDLQGYPGELTEKEVEAALKFRAELEKRAQEVEGGNAYPDMVRAFKPVEEEPYALCRFLRSRNFNVDEVMSMMDEGIDVWKDGERHDFFPDPDVAVGAPLSILLSQYPFLYSGIARNGCPVSYFLTGRVSVEGIECVTELDNLAKLVWHIMMYDFPGQVAKAQEENPNVVRCEAVSVFDLKGLRASNLNSRTLEMLKKVIEINICFPEVLNSLVVLNAPHFFSFAWKIVRPMLDPRTTSKINIFSNEKKGNQWLVEHIHPNELLEDYGGKSDSFETAMQKKGPGMVFKRQLIELLSVPKRGTKLYAFELARDEKAQVQVYTRSVAGADVSVAKGSEAIKTVLVKNETVSNGGDAPKPYCTDVMSEIAGPGKFRITVKSKDAAEGNQFLLVVRVD